MTEQEKFEQVSEPNLSPGQVLSQARQAQGLSVEELSELIKVPLDVIEAIEKDKVPKNLPETFIRGYIRSYAKKVGVSEDLVLTSVVTTAAYEKVDRGPSQMQSFSRRTKRKAFERRLVLTTWVIGGALALSLAIWWYQEKGMDFAPLASFSGQEQVEEATTAVATTEITAPAQEVTQPAFSDTELQSVAEPAVEDEVQDETSTSDTTDTESNESSSQPSEQPLQTAEEVVEDTVETLQQNIDTTPVDTVTVQQEQQAPIVLTDAQSALLADNGEVDEEGFIRVEMQFENDCWVEVYDVAGERIAIGNKPAGYLMTLNAQGPFNVLLGNPVGVSIWVNGKEFDTSNLPRNRVARFELDIVDAALPEVVQ